MLFGELRYRVGVPRQVPDDPRVVHAVAGRRDLGVVVGAEDLHRIELPDPQHGLAKLGVPVSLRRGEPVVIDLRLGVMVRRVARPPARHGDHLAQHQIGVRIAGAAVEDRPHIAVASAADLALAPVLVRHVVGLEQSRREGARVGDFVDRELGRGVTGQPHRRAGGDMDAGRRLVEDRPPSHPLRSVADAACGVAVHQQPGGFPLGLDIVHVTVGQPQHGQGDAGTVFRFVDAGNRRQPRREAATMVGDVDGHGVASFRPERRHQRLAGGDGRASSISARP